MKDKIIFSGNSNHEKAYAGGNATNEIIPNGLISKAEVKIEDKEKQIMEINESELTEIANIIVKTDFDYCGMCWQENSFVRCPYGEPMNCQSCLTAKNILDLGYRKLPKDSVVLSREEYCELKQAKTLLEINKEEINNLADANIRYSIALENKGKETAEKIYKMADEICTGSQNDGDKILAMIKDTFGVEIKE